MTTKVVVRLLDADLHLLGWADVPAVARGDGQLWSPGPVVIPIERDGEAWFLSVHWADVHVESRTVLDVRSVVRVGQIVPVFPAASPILIVGPIPGALPAVTARGSVGVVVPVGQIGAHA